MLLKALGLEGHDCRKLTLVVNGQEAIQVAIEEIVTYEGHPRRLNRTFEMTSLSDVKELAFDAV